MLQSYLRKHGRDLLFRKPVLVLARSVILIREMPGL